MAEFDIVIHGGRLIDGTGNPWFYGDVAIKGGKIAGIGKIDPEFRPAVDFRQRTGCHPRLHRHAHAQRSAVDR